MDNITLSIIIPCYNVSIPILGKCLESIQFISELMSYEVWLIDDGSQDDVVCQWVSGLNRPEIHALRQENMGPGGARNTGIDHSIGEYITFVDADDYLQYGPYYMILQKLLELKPDILCHGCLQNYQGSAIKFMMLYDICPSCCSYIIRRTSLGDLRFTPHIYHEDEEFCTRLHLRRSHLVTTMIAGYFYRYRQESITHNPDEEHIRKRYKDFLTVMTNLQHEQIHPPYQLALNRRLDIMAMCYVVTLMSDTTGKKMTRSAIKELRHIGMFPLPLRWHGWRYLIIKLAMFDTLPVLLFTPVVKFLLKIHRTENSSRAFVAQKDLWNMD